jgi:hypothetical protein
VAYWTSASTFDDGIDIAGSPVPIATSNSTTTFDFSLSGLDSVAAPTSVEFSPGIQLFSDYLTDPAASTTLSESFGMSSNIDWSQVNTAFLLQYEPSTLGPLNNLVLGPELSLSGLSFTDGATNTITQALQPSPQASLSVSVPGSQWAPLFINASPAAPTQYSSAITLDAEAYVTGGRNAAGTAFGADLILAGTALQTSGFGFSSQPFGGCGGDEFPPLGGINSQPAILTDQDLGTLQYGDPFPSSWTRSLTFCQQAVVPIAVPNSTSTADFTLVAGESVAPSNAPLAPLVGTVEAPTINGASLFTANTLNTTVAALSWSAPSGTKPYGYRVEVFTATTLPDGRVTYLPASTFSTAKTSVTLLPLTAGNTYVFAISARVDGTANIETSPLRSSLPAAFSNVVSAPITISSGASSPAIRGDAKVVRRLSQPRAGGRFDGTAAKAAAY